MKVAFFVNRTEDELAEYTTTRLAMAAAKMGHTTYYLDADSFAFDSDEHLHGRARMAPAGADTFEDFMEEVQNAEPDEIVVDELDALMLRNETEAELPERPWAQMTGFEFGRLASERGVTVVNDPTRMASASSKLYLQFFPARIRPRTLITRSEDDLKAFVRDQRDGAVIKPLRGAKGENVFFARPEDDANVSQMIEAVLRDGYVIAQEFLPRGEEGDVRVLLLDGVPLQIKGHYAALRRIPPAEDLRSNMAAGGSAAPAEMTDAIFEIVEEIAPRLRDDGMFFVGIDVVGDKLIEINVESPGGIGSASEFAGVDFAPPIIEALEARAMKNVRRSA